MSEGAPEQDHLQNVAHVSQAGRDTAWPYSIGSIPPKIPEIFPEFRNSENLPKSGILLAKSGISVIL